MNKVCSIRVLKTIHYLMFFNTKQTLNSPSMVAFYSAVSYLRGYLRK